MYRIQTAGALLPFLGFLLAFVLSSSLLGVDNQWVGFGLPSASPYGDALAQDSSGDLYVGSNGGSGLVMWSPQDCQWHTLGSGLTGTVYALLMEPNGTLVVGGLFTVGLPGGGTVSNLAAWNGTSWSAVGGAITAGPQSGAVMALALDAVGGLYIGGLFATVNGMSSPSIAYWSGTNWLSIGGLSGGWQVNALAVDGTGQVWVGGRFDVILSGTDAVSLASWNPSSHTWTSRGADLTQAAGYIYSPTGPVVNALVIDGTGGVVCAGAFTAAGTASANNIARWNGTAWQSMGAGLSGGGVWGLTAATASVVATGYFNASGSTTLGGLASWNGTSWADVGGGVGAVSSTNAPIAALVDSFGGIIITGSFSGTATRSDLRGTARWSVGTPPTCTLSSATGPFSGDFPVTITFSSSVTGFTASNIHVTGTAATVGVLTGSGSAYTATVHRVGLGTVILEVYDSAGIDAVGDGNTPSNILTCQLQGPDVTCVLSSSAGTLTNGPFTVTATFSQPVVGMVAGDVIVVNGSISGFTGSGSTYSWLVTPTPGQAAVGNDVSPGGVTNAVGDPADSPSVLVVDIETTPPSVVLSTASSSTTTAPIAVTVSFSEPVTGFAAGSLTVTNGSVRSLLGSGAVYTASIQPTTFGTVSVSVPSGVATDAAGNPNQPSAALAVTFQQPAPGITSALTTTNTVGISFTYQITASNSPSSFGAVGLPSGLTVNPTTGLINGTPTSLGSTTVTLSATNATGTGTAVLTITVQSPPPMITGLTPSTGPLAGGTSVTISGTNLTAANTVSFGSTAATIAANTATWIVVTTPAGVAGAVDVSVTTNSGTVTSTGAFTYSASAPSGSSPVASPSTSGGGGGGGCGLGTGVAGFIMLSLVLLRFRRLR